MKKLKKAQDMLEKYGCDILENNLGFSPIPNLPISNGSSQSNKWH